MVCIKLGLNQDYKKLRFEHRLLHNTRKNKKTKNSIFSKDENYNYVCDEIKKLTTTSDLKKYFEDEEENYKLLIKEKTGRKSQMKNHLMESLISFSFSDYEKYGSEKLKKIIMDYIKKLKNEYKIKIYNISFHFDEGHFEDEEEHFQDENKNKKEIKNVHCHFIHSNINHETGKSFTRGIFMAGKKNDYSFIQNDLQDFILKNLDPNFEKQNKEKKEKQEYIEDYKIYKKIKQNEQKIIQKYKKQIKNIKEKTISELKKQQEQLRQKHNEIIYLKKEIFDLKEKLKLTTTQSQQHQIQRKINNLEKSQNVEIGL